MRFRDIPVGALFSFGSNRGVNAFRKTLAGGGPNAEWRENERDVPIGTRCVFFDDDDNSFVELSDTEPPPGTVFTLDLSDQGGPAFALVCPERLIKNGTFGPEHLK